MQKKNGVSLIVLIITIIVMIILAGVIMIQLNNSDIIKKAHVAVNETNLQEVKQLAALKWSEAYIESKGKATEDELRNAVIRGLKGIDITPYTITVTTKGVTVDVICYYNMLSMAIADINNKTIGKNADAENKESTVKVSIQDGKTVVELLKNTTENERIILDNDMTIILGGNTITFNDCVGFDTLTDKTNKIYIDGKIEGSQIASVTTSSNACTIQVKTGNKVTVEGANLITNSENGGVIRNISVSKQASLQLTNCNLTTRSNSEEKAASGVYIGSNSNVTITNCNINTFVNTSKGKCYGILNYGECEVYNTTIKTYSDYGYSDNAYTIVSQGIYNSAKGTITLTNCNVMGNHAGVSSSGNLYVNYGTYEGYGHGGFYFSSDGDGTEKIYVKNATIRTCKMPEGYTDLGAGYNGASAYIGGNSTANNITVYMDNCIFGTSAYAFVLRGSSWEKNNTLYISNSTINKGTKLRIDNNTHRLYIGEGNNFDVTNVWTPSEFDLTTVVFKTNEVYVKQ